GGRAGRGPEATRCRAGTSRALPPNRGDSDDILRRHRGRRARTAEADERPVAIMPDHPEGAALRPLVILPMYNECETIRPIVSAVLSQPGQFSVLVVDDNSPDGTGAVAEELKQEHAGRVDVLHRAGKLGLGTAYVAGFRWALARDFTHVLEMDAD